MNKTNYNNEDDNNRFIIIIALFSNIYHDFDV